MISRIELLQQVFLPPLPGALAHAAMAPPGRPVGLESAEIAQARPSSVLILLHQRVESIFFTLIQRATYPGAHSGEIGFPGGSREPGDLSHWDTALRETREELGIDTTNISFLGELTPVYIQNSNFIVYPQVGLMLTVPAMKPRVFEVAKAFHVPLSKLFEPGVSGHFSPVIKGPGFQAPCFKLAGHQVWGATAMILNELVEAFKRKAPKVFRESHSCNERTFPGSL